MLLQSAQVGWGTGLNPGVQNNNQVAENQLCPAWSALGLQFLLLLMHVLLLFGCQRGPAGLDCSWSSKVCRGEAVRDSNLGDSFPVSLFKEIRWRDYV